MKFSNKKFTRIKYIAASITLFSHLLTCAANETALPPCDERAAEFYDHCIGSRAQARSVYLGPFEQNLANGLGTQNFEDGSKFVGQFKRGKPEGRGVLTRATGEYFVGDFVDGNLPRGAKVWPDGAKYYGEFRQFMREGSGVFEMANGGTYTGRFRADRFDGNGEFKTKTSSYVGEWKNGKNHGLGRLILFDDKGQKAFELEGQFENDKLNGFGARTTYPAEVKEIGKWSQGELTGIATMAFKDGTKLVAPYVNSGYNGVGYQTFANGTVYKGNFSNGAFQGEGGIYEDNKILFKGYYKDGSPHGTGTLYAGGKVTTGNFVNGKMQGDFYFTDKEGIPWLSVAVNNVMGPARMNILDVDIEKYKKISINK